MSRLRFVQPQLVRLPLSDGDYADIKHELTAGEDRAYVASLTMPGEPGKPLQVDPSRVQYAKVVAYLVGWSFQDASGQPVPVSPDAIGQLDVDTFRELYAAIDAHEEARDAKKKPSLGDGSGSSPTSPSPAG